MISAQEGLERLREGNGRFVSGIGASEALPNQARRGELVAGQNPLAIILGCSDSRVPPEIIFDQGPGDLFVIRVAGNVAAPSQIGCVEYAATEFGTQLLVVLGHTHCGAVRATVNALQQPSESLSLHVHSIVDRIRPSVEPLLATDFKQDPDTLVRHAVRANVRASVSSLRSESEILEHRIKAGALLVVGAEYSLDNGIVDFFDGVPENRQI